MLCAFLPPASGGEKTQPHVLPSLRSAKSRRPLKKESKDLALIPLSQNTEAHYMNYSILNSQKRERERDLTHHWGPEDGLVPPHKDHLYY